MINTVLTDFQAARLVTGNMTVQNNATSRRISSAVFAEMLGIWLVTVRTDSAAATCVTTFPEVASMAHNDVLALEMLSTRRWR